MPFDSFTLESAFFLSLLTILASLPTDPYFQPWHDNIPTYRISNPVYYPQTQGRSGSAFETPFLYRTPPRGGGYRPRQISRSPQGVPRPEIESRSGRRNLDALPGEEYQGEEAYSSHVNSEQNQKGGPEKAPKNIRERKFGYDSEEGDEKINLQDPTRDLRIVVPKRRRPPQGRPSKNGSKPCTTNTISTTEKTFGNETKWSRRPQGGEIVFPDVYNKKFIPRVSKCAKKSTFCEHLGEEYPSDHISQVLRTEGAMFKEFFGKDVISDPDITERINAPEENLCPYRQEVVFPRAAQNKEDKWLFIINQDQYVQGVTVEVCLNPESRCMLTDGFPLGYTPYCKQKYIERRLVAIGEDGKPHSDSFRLPSCCSCVVKHETTARMGFSSAEGRRGT